MDDQSPPKASNGQKLEFNTPLNDLFCFFKKRRGNASVPLPSCGCPWWHTYIIVFYGKVLINYSYLIVFYCTYGICTVKGVGRKFFKGGGATEKKDRKKAKKWPKNSTFKPLSTIFVLCLKIQGVQGPLPPAADAHVHSAYYAVPVLYFVFRECKCDHMVVNHTLFFTACLNSLLLWALKNSHHHLCMHVEEEK